MKSNVIFNKLAAVFCLAALSGVAYAEETISNLPMPSVATPYTHDSKLYMLALNENGGVNEKASAAPVVEFEPAAFSGSNAHKYLGLGTVILAGLTAVTAPGEGCENNCPPVSQQPPRETNGTHAKLGKAAAAMAMATVATGLISHWDDFHFEDGFTDPDNMHAMLGTAGALLMTYAVVKSAHSSVKVSHAGEAELGALAMVFAIKLTW
jgi:hypothetical protein